MYETRIFLNSLKNMLIVPIYIAIQKNIARNYRSIFLLSPMSTIFEKLLHSRLDFFSENELITKQRFGFCCGYSTEMAITDLYN